jgi:hypothetical protein
MHIIHRPVFYLKTRRFGDWIISVFRWNVLSWAQDIKLVSIFGPDMFRTVMVINFT